PPTKTLLTPQYLLDCPRPRIFPRVQRVNIACTIIQSHIVQFARVPYSVAQGLHKAVALTVHISKSICGKKNVHRANTVNDLSLNRSDNAILRLLVHGIYDGLFGAVSVYIINLSKIPLYALS